MNQSNLKTLLITSFLKSDFREVTITEELNGIWIIVFVSMCLAVFSVSIQTVH